jgi:hypothetical protein
MGKTAPVGLLALRFSTIAHATPALDGALARCHKVEE